MGRQSYARQKAQRIRLQLLAEAGCPLATPGRKNDPWPALKAKLDKAFSELIRLTHADDQGMVTCIDGCGKTGHWKDFDCGHFVHRDKLPTRWDMDNCRPQAQYCNRKQDGKPYEFGRALNLENPGLADRLIEKGAGPGHEIRDRAPAMLLEIRAKLKVQRKRFRHG